MRHALRVDFETEERPDAYVAVDSDPICAIHGIVPSGARSIASSEFARVTRELGAPSEDRLLRAHELFPFATCDIVRACEGLEARRFATGHLTIMNGSTAWSVT
jgi:hypothetical protein